MSNRKWRDDDNGPPFWRRALYWIADEGLPYAFLIGTWALAYWSYSTMPPLDPRVMDYDPSRRGWTR